MTQNQDSEIKILLVDSDSAERDSLEKLLEQLIKCKVAHSGDLRSALEEINVHKPDLIISEWLLNSHLATKLLKVLRSRGEWSEIPVIIHTNDPSEEIHSKAKQNGAYDVISKPANKYILSWNLGLLFSIPESEMLASTKSPLREETYRERLDQLKVGRIKSLAPLPKLAQRIMEISHDPNSTPKDLADIIQRDQVLTAKILKIVNSAYYGFPRKIGHIDRAIIVLGFNEVNNITLAACLMQVYPIGGESPYFDREAFWLHSLSTAFIARSLSSQIPALNPREAFVVGLLHDIGMVVLDQQFREIFNHVLALAKEKNQPLYEISREVLNTDHAEIGGIIADSWNLPSNLVNAIQYHHKPMLARKDQYEVHLAHIANYMSHKYGVGSSGNPVLDVPFIGSLKVLKLQDKNLDDVWATLKINNDLIKALV